MYALQGTTAPAVAEHQENSSPEPPEVKLQPGVLVEFSGPGAREEAARLLARNPQVPAAWIEQQLDPFPDEVRRHRLNWDRVLFIEGKKDAAWSLSALLRSECFPILVYYAPYGTERTLRRIRKLAKASRTMVVLLSETPYPVWQIHYQYGTQNGRLELLRGRHL